MKKEPFDEHLKGRRDSFERDLMNNFDCKIAAVLLI